MSCPEARLDIQSCSKRAAFGLRLGLGRVLQALQNFGQLASFSSLPPALASFHSRLHLAMRSRAAAWAGGRLLLRLRLTGRLDGAGHGQDHRRGDGYTDNAVQDLIPQGTFMVTG